MNMERKNIRGNFALIAEKNWTKNERKFKEPPLKKFDYLK
jgi:hypothetical protein